MRMRAGFRERAEKEEEAGMELGCRREGKVKARGDVGRGSGGGFEIADDGIGVADVVGGGVVGVAVFDLLESGLE